MCQLIDCRITRQIDAEKLKRKSTGLEDVVGSLKKKKLSSIAKSHLDWSAYKKENDLEDELKRDTKGGYLDEQVCQNETLLFFPHNDLYKAFLERADWRQFEKEKAVRDVERSRRLDKSNPA